MIPFLLWLAGNRSAANKFGICWRVVLQHPTFQHLCYTSRTCPLTVTYQPILLTPSMHALVCLHFAKSFSSLQKLFWYMQGAVETSLVALDGHRWVSLQSSAVRRQKSLSRTPSDSSSKLARSPSKGAGAPYELMDHPPLAVLTNGLLNALNELRFCAPLSLHKRLAAVLQVRFPAHISLNSTDR